MLISMYYHISKSVGNDLTKPDKSQLPSPDPNEHIPEKFIISPRYLAVKKQLHVT